MELLKDPLKDRVVSSAALPVGKPLQSSCVFDKNGIPNWKTLKDLFSREGSISKSDFLSILNKVTEIFRREPNLLQTDDPITVVGDIHGQYFDLLKILEVGGNPETTKYLFLGDYVDRGMFSIEVLVLLFSLKTLFPKNIYLIRGNHESRQMTSMFSFRKECIYKYDLEVYEAVMTSFDTLPLGCLVNNSFLAVHGGISPDLKTLKDINNINRMIEPPRAGLLCDLLWSDPVDSPDGRVGEVYRNNETRGCSFFFGAEATRRLLKENDLITIIRGHEVQKEGYKMNFWNGNEFPSIITIFSAPNYCDCYKNKGAVIKFHGGTLNIQQYNFSKHPYILPDYMDIFTWSIPFVIDKILRMLHTLVKPMPAERQRVDRKSIALLKELESCVQGSPEIRADNIEKIVDYIRTVREKHENIILGQNGFSDGVHSGQPITHGILNDDNDSFVRALTLDRDNERRPA